MENYHNQYVNKDEAKELADFVNSELSKNPFILPWNFSDVADEILSNPDYVDYDRDLIEEIIESMRPWFIARNERIDPSESGI